MWTGFLPLIFSQSDMHAHTHSRHRVCSCKPSPLPPTSLSLSVPLVLALTLTYTLLTLFQASIRRSKGERVTEVGGRGRQTGFGVQVHVEKMTWKTVRRRAERESTDWNILFFSRHRYLPWNQEGEIEKKKKEHTRTNERKSNAGRRERRTRKCIPAPSPEFSAMAHSSFFPPSHEPLSLAFLSIVPSLSFSPLPPPHAVARVHMRPYDFSLFLSLPLSGDCSASHPRSLAASSVFLPPGRRNTRSLSNGPPTPLRASLKYQAPSTAHFPTCLGAWSPSALFCTSLTFKTFFIHVFCWIFFQPYPTKISHS